MRKVYSHAEPAGGETTEARRNLRAMLKESPEKFFARLQAMEKDWLAEKRRLMEGAGAVEKLSAQAQDERGAVDPGSESVLDAIRGLLERKPWESEA